MWATETVQSGRLLCSAGNAQSGRRNDPGAGILIAARAATHIGFNGSRQSCGAQTWKL